MSSTVPTLIPEKRILFPTCKPLILEKDDESLNTGLKRFFCFPIMKTIIVKIASPTVTKKPQPNFKFCCM
jgi:hypothetical protein